MNEVTKNLYLAIKREYLNRISQRPDGYLRNECAANGGAAVKAMAEARRGRMPYFGKGKQSLSHGDVIRLRNREGEKMTFVIGVYRDDDCGAPWEVHDGHGVVSEWTTRDKKAGELVLCEDGRRKRYYDFAETCKIARRDGWNAKPYDIEGETPKQRAAKAAKADYERMRAWCNDEWNWQGVAVFLLPRDGEQRNPEYVANQEPFGILQSNALWGIESDSDEYISETALELANEMASA